MSARSNATESVRVTAVSLPVYGREAFGREIFVGFLEMAAAKESPIYGKWGWMGAFKNEMPLSVDDGAFAPGIAAPEHEHEIFALFGEF